MRGVAAARTWTTREGQEIPITRLDDSHLVNIIHFLRKRGEIEKHDALLTAYSMASMLSGDQAELAIDREISTLESACTDEFLDMTLPQWEYLMTEVDKRNLYDQI